jgi:membrane protease YdiL (CAAX protease family)
MAVESAGFALGLLVVSRELRPFLNRAGIALQAAAPPTRDVAAQVITFVGAGIYEEVLFRLVLFAGLMWLLRQIGLLSLPTFVLATVGSAMLFSAAHHAGPYGEPFNKYAFLFRTIAGLYFTLLFQLRGFGIAAGAHASYDVLVGILLR